MTTMTYSHFELLYIISMHRQTYTTYKNHQQTQQPVDQHLFKTAFKKAKTEDRVSEVLTNTFHVLNLSSANNKHPGMYDQEIEHMKTNSFLLGSAVDKKSSKQQSFLDFKTVYPLSKAGTFGSLYRQCTISQNGVQEKQGNSKYKHKDITGFLNKIQKFGHIGNEKLQWLKQSKQYPFRIILLGSKKQQKGIYFKTIEEAQKVRIHYINKFILKNNVKKTLGIANNRFQEQVINNFKYYLIANLRLNGSRNKKKKSNIEVSESRLMNDSEVNRSKQDSIIENQSRIEHAPQVSHVKKFNQEDYDPLDDVLGRTSNDHRRNDGYPTEVMSHLREQEQLRRSRNKQDLNRSSLSKNLFASSSPAKKIDLDPDLILQLENQYYLTMFQLWKQKANGLHKKYEARDRRVKGTREKEIEKNHFKPAEQSYQHQSGVKRTRQKEIEKSNFKPAEQSYQPQSRFQQNTTINDHRSQFRKNHQNAQKGHQSNYQSINQSPPKISEEKGRNIPNDSFDHHPSKKFIGKSSLNTQSLGRLQPNQSNKKIGKSIVSFQNIQFLKLTDSFIKPIITIKLEDKEGKTQGQSIYNTMLKSKLPHLTYELLFNSGREQYEISKPLSDYTVKVKAIDYLSNSQITNDDIGLKGRDLSQYTILLNKQKTMRVQMKCEMWDNGDVNGIKYDDNPQGCFLEIKQLDPRVLQNFRTFWEHQSVKRGYYNTSKQIKMMEILELYQQVPKSWCLGLEERIYKLVGFMHSAAEILQFKLTPSIIPLLKTLIRLYHTNQQVIQVCISMMMNYLKPYYFPTEFNKPQELHLLLGIQGQIEHSSKIQLQMKVFERILHIECQQLMNKMVRRNICFTHLMFQYIYEFYSQVFPIKTLIEIWNFCFQNPRLIQIYLLLLAVWVIRFYNHKLILCRRFRQIRPILQSHKTCVSDVIIRELLVLREKYFSKSKTIIESIKGLFTNKPLESVVVDFFKTQTEKMSKRKEIHAIEKINLLKKLNNQTHIQVPQYPPKTYSLHIYFYNLPDSNGTLSIKTGNNHFECLDFSIKKYFIIGDICNDVIIEFIDASSQEYTCQLQLFQGVNQMQLTLRSINTKNTYQIKCVCGLLTDSQIETIKKNKNFEHYISSYATQSQIKDEFIRNQYESLFLNSIKRFDRDDLAKKLKVMFSSGNRSFDEVQLYLWWISHCPYTLPEKQKLIQYFASNLSEEFYLTKNKQLQKLFLFDMLQIINFSITPSVFESYYADSLQNEFNASKIIKCRLFLSDGSELKLQQIAILHFASQCTTYLYGDVSINKLLAEIYKQKYSQLMHMNDGKLWLLYSSYGKVQSLQIPVIKKKATNELIIDETNYQLTDFEGFGLETVEPEVLMNQILPTFSKITTILEFVNVNKNVENLTKKQNKKLVEPINLLKNCHKRLRKVVLMRYLEHPQKVTIPFLQYYHDLIFTPTPPMVPTSLFFNNARTDINTIMTYNGKLSFRDSKRGQSSTFDKDLGLYGNFRNLHPKTEAVYFTSILQDEECKSNALVFINYGFGVYRWQKCKVVGYMYTIKESSSNLSEKKKPRKIYVAHHRGSIINVRDFQLEMDEEEKNKIEEYDEKQAKREEGMRRRQDLSSKLLELAMANKKRSSY